MCGAKHMSSAEHQDAKMSDADCTIACVKKGAKHILIRDGKVYDIDNQDFADLAVHAGHSVQLTGEPAGNTIKVSKIEVATPKEQ